MNKLATNLINGKKNHKKKLFKRPVLFSVIILLFISSIWLLTTFVRYNQFKNRYERHSTKQLINLDIFPDTVRKVTKMPNFEYIDWQKLSTKVDSEGIVVCDFDALTIRGVSGKQRCLWKITSFAQEHLKNFLITGNLNDELLGFRQIDYLVKNFKTTVINDEEVGLWEVEFDLGYQYQVKAPWYSGLYQGYCLFTMLNAYQISNDQKYLDIFEKGIRAYKYDVKDGGLSYRTKNGGLFFQEVACLPYHHILNGHMAVLILLEEYSRVYYSKEIKDIFNLGLQGLIDMLPNFDRYGYSLYSLSPNPGINNHFNIASPAYHYVHITQLGALVDITGNKELNRYATKWKSKRGSIFENLWFSLYTMFKDTIYLTRLIKRTIKT